MIMGIPIFEAKTIRQVPLYVRWRVRTVHELMKAASMKIAGQNKAFGVFDYSRF